jgi:hypothetical protein
MKKLLIVVGCALAFSAIGTSETVWGQTALAGKPKSFSIAVGSQRLQKSMALRISIEDAKAKSGVCPYYVRSFEYLPGANLLNIEVYQEACANDAYGFSQGEAIWVAPLGIQTKGSKVSVLVNQTPAGTLIYDQETQLFSVNGD